MPRGNKRFAYVLVAAVGLIIAPALHQEATPPASQDAPRPFAPARFDIDWLRGKLRLSGDTLSAHHEQQLLLAARQSFPQQTVITVFRPLGTAPDYWQDATVRTLHALAPTLSARATLHGDTLDIRGVTGDAIAWQSGYAALREVLPETVSLSADTIVVGDDLDTAQACNAAFATFETGAINFQESTAILRSAAYPRLDRVIAIADACRESFVSITGHTDSSGDENWNRLLSIKRADAVANYIAAGGIDRERLRTEGAGSATPVASNRTRYGRSLNRRIEIDFALY